MNTFLVQDVVLQTRHYWNFTLSGLLSALQVAFPAACARKAHSDGTQSFFSPVASSIEAFQLLQWDLTKISCTLLNSNLLSNVPFSISVQKGLTLCVAAI